MDLNRGNQGLARVFMAYNVLAALVWVLRVGWQSPVPAMVVVHLGLAWLLAARSRRRMFPGFPWLLWLLAWAEIGWLYRLTGPVVHDGTIRLIDLALFGRHLNEVLAGILPWAWLRETMGLSYLSYYLLILVPPIVLAVQRRTRDLQIHTFGLLSTYLACFTVYLVLPVLGPRAVIAGTGGHVSEAAGLFAGVMEALFAAGDSLGTAFPSSHCAASVAAALLVRRHFGPLAGGVSGIWAGLIVMSTVYTNNHYAIDAVAGVVVAVVIGYAVQKWLGDRRAAHASCGGTPGTLNHEEVWS